MELTQPQGPDSIPRGQWVSAQEAGSREEEEGVCHLGHAATITPQAKKSQHQCMYFFLAHVNPSYKYCFTFN